MRTKITAWLCCAALALAFGAAPAGAAAGAGAGAGRGIGLNIAKCIKLQEKYLNAVAKGKDRRADRLLKKLNKKCSG